jgi:hypothetical protein
MMLIKTVSTVVATDSTGRPVDALPVRTAVAGETDAAGRPVDAVPVTEDPLGRPVRFVTGKAAQNSAGQWVDTIPVLHDGASGPYPAPSGYRWGYVTENSITATENGEPVVELERIAA